MANIGTTPTLKWLRYVSPRRVSRHSELILQIILQAVRSGLNVVAVFYGHPGVFVAPSHRAIAIARDEGYPARMAPAISAEDCLFADLGIDPSKPGCLTYEASDFMLRSRPLVPSSHLVLFQIGCIGVHDFNFAGFKNDHFPLLIDRLVHTYGPSHPAVSYTAAVSPQSPPSLLRFTLSELKDPSVAARINGVSTLYVPPKDTLGTLYQVALDMGLLKPGTTYRPSARPYPPNRWADSDTQAAPAYGPKEKAAVLELGTHEAPKGYKSLTASQSMRDITIRLALDPAMLAAFQTDPVSFTDEAMDCGQTLSVHEAIALRSGDPQWIKFAMTATEEDVETLIRFERGEAMNLSGAVQVHPNVVVETEVEADVDEVEMPGWESSTIMGLGGEEIGPAAI